MVKFFYRSFNHGINCGLTLITYNLRNKEQVDIEIRNSIGVAIKRIHKNIGKTTSDKTEIDVRNLADGLYYVIVRAGTKTFTNKFVKIK